MTKFPARLITTNQIEASDVLRFELLDAADLVHFASARLRNARLTLCLHSLNLISLIIAADLLLLETAFCGAAGRRAPHRRS
jgi:hypothetical protein